MLDRILKLLRLKRSIAAPITSTATAIRHPGNAPGDFYSTVGCILCNAPATVAPNLIGYVQDENGEHCVVTRQPKTEMEITNMIQAMDSSCVECYRYSGNDIKIIKLLEENRLSHLCDASA